MVGTWYVKVRKIYTYELPNPCSEDDLSRALRFMSSQLAARAVEHAGNIQISADEEHIYVEMELKPEKEQLNSTGLLPKSKSLADALVAKANRRNDNQPITGEPF